MRLSTRDANVYFAKPDPSKTGLLIYGIDAMRVSLKRQQVVKALLGPSAEEEMRLTRLPGADLITVTGGDGATGAQTLWFGYAGAPERRNPAGARLGGWSQDAAITLSGGHTITIRRTTGAME